MMAALYIQTGVPVNVATLIMPGLQGNQDILIHVATFISGCVYLEVVLDKQTPSIVYQ